MKKKTLLLLALSAMVIGGCSKSEIDEATINPTNSISFSTSTDKLTKGTVLDNTTATNYDFSVFAYSTGTSAWGDFTPSDADFMNNQKVEYDEGWTYTPTKYWPNSSDEKISFFGYMPYDATYTVASVSTTTGLPEIVFTQDMDAEDMIDLTVAQALDQSKANSTVVMSFDHILTRMNFAAKTETELDDATEVYVTGLKLLGSTNNTSSKLYSKATYALADGTDANGNGSWTYPEDAVIESDDLDLAAIINTTEYTETSTTGVVLNTDATATQLLTAGQYLFLIPPTATGATSGTDVYIEVAYSVITTDTGLTSDYKKIDATSILAMPVGSLQSEVAYNVVLSIGLDEVKMDVEITDIDNDDESTSTDADKVIFASSADELVSLITNAFSDNTLNSYSITYKGDEGELSVDLSTVAISDANKGMDLVINLPNQSDGVEITIPDGYTGNIIIYAPNASVTAETTNGTEYTDVTVTTADQTFIISAGVVVNGLTILGGNVEVYGELSGVVARGNGNQDVTTTIYFMEGSTNSTTSIGENCNIAAAATVDNKTGLAEAITNAFNSGYGSFTVTYTGNEFSIMGVDNDVAGYGIDLSSIETNLGMDLTIRLPNNTGDYFCFKLSNNYTGQLSIYIPNGNFVGYSNFYNPIILTK